MSFRGSASSADLTLSLLFTGAAAGASERVLRADDESVAGRAGHARQIHRRRHHGVLRLPDRGPRSSVPGVSRGAGHAARDGRAQSGMGGPGPFAHPHAHRHQHGDCRGRQHGHRYDIQLHGAGRRRDPGVALRGRQQGVRLAGARRRGHLHACPRRLRDEGTGPASRQGQGPPGCGIRARGGCSGARRRASSSGRSRSTPATVPVGRSWLGAWSTRSIRRRPIGTACT